MIAERQVVSVVTDDPVSTSSSEQYVIFITAKDLVVAMVVRLHRRDEDDFAILEQAQETTVALFDNAMVTKNDTMLF